MPFAAVTNVKLEGRDPVEGQKFLSEVLIPWLTTLPGFQTARFLRTQDGTTGVGAVIFDTASNARAALDADRPAGGPPIESTAIYEVVLEV